MALTSIRDAIYGLSGRYVRFNRLYHRLTQFIWGTRTVQQMKEILHQVLFLRGGEERKEIWKPKRNRTRVFFLLFLCFFQFFWILPLLWEVIEGITDLFTMPAVRYNVASHLRAQNRFRLIVETIEINIARVRLEWRWLVFKYCIQIQIRKI